MSNNDPRLTYVATTTKSIQEYIRLMAEVGVKRARAIKALQADGITISEIAEATGIGRQTLYKASQLPEEKKELAKRAAERKAEREASKGEVVE